MGFAEDINQSDEERWDAVAAALPSHSASYTVTPEDNLVVSMDTPKGVFTLQTKYHGVLLWFYQVVVEGHEASPEATLEIPISEVNPAILQGWLEGFESTV